MTGVSRHMRFFDTALQKLSSITSKYNVILPCVDGWIQNINALRLLWSECQLHIKFKIIICMHYQIFFMLPGFVNFIFPNL